MYSLWQALFGKRLPPVIAAVLRDGLTYLESEALLDLYTEIRRLERRGAEGILIEAGCALGGSALVMASAKARTRPFFIYDVFGMIPPPSDKDDADVQERYRIIRTGQSEGIHGGKYYGYEENLYDKVHETFRRYDLTPESNAIHFVQGLFQDTLRVTQPVALAHLDGDWYESVLTCLKAITPHLIPGGILVIDDYDSWSGCRKAVDEYFSDKKDQYKLIQRSRLHLVRK